MEVALLNVKVTFQKHEVVTDDIGNHTNDWTDYYSCFATAGGEDSVKSTEGETAATTTDHSGISFTVRCCKATSVINSTEYRVIFGDEIYNILSVDHMNFKRKSLKVRCEKERRS
ncbi:MAG: phage head closure protein [Lachnospiraceae bacterium]|nr:phage head closure protein [Lachnospiraceae bacterium]